MKSFRVWKVWDGLGCVVSLATIFNRPAHHTCINGYALRLAGVVSLLAFGVPLAGSAAPRQQLRGGHVPAAVARLQPIGRLPATNQLRLIIGLPLRNQETLTNLLHQIYDPSSPNYHHYLTPKEFTQRFGPTEKDYQAIIAFAKANGLTVTGTHPDRTLLDVSASVAEIEKALHITMHIYRHPKEARTFYAPDSEPSLDLTLPVLAISGLNNYVVPKPLVLRQDRATQANNATPAAGSAPDGVSYMGTNFTAAYVPGTPFTGSGQAGGLVPLHGFFPKQN